MLAGSGSACCAKWVWRVCRVVVRWRERRSQRKVGTILGRTRAGGGGGVVAAELAVVDVGGVSVVVALECRLCCCCY